MKKLGEILHQLGIHQWNKWQYVNDKSCEQERSCEYGDKTQKQTAHTYPASYYMLGSSCSGGGCAHCKLPEGAGQTREYNCVRCGEKLA